MSSSCFWVVTAPAVRVGMPHTGLPGMTCAHDALQRVSPNLDNSHRMMSELMAQLRRRLPPVNSMVVLRGGRPAAELHPRRRGAGADPVGGEPADPAVGGASRRADVPAAGAQPAAHPRRRAPASRGDDGAGPHRRHRGRHPPPSRHRRAHGRHQRDLRQLLADGAARPSSARNIPTSSCGWWPRPSCTIWWPLASTSRSAMAAAAGTGSTGSGSSTTRSGRSARRPISTVGQAWPRSRICSTRRCSISASSIATG